MTKYISFSAEYSDEKGSRGVIAQKSYPCIQERWVSSLAGRTFPPQTRLCDVLQPNGRRWIVRLAALGESLQWAETEEEFCHRVAAQVVPEGISYTLEDL